MDNINQQNKDEISFIDLLTIFIRYRKLIIIGTLISFCICLAYFIINPLINKKISNPVSYTTSIIVTLDKNLNSNLKNLPTTDYETFVADIILQPKNQFRALVQNNYYLDTLDSYKKYLFTTDNKYFIVKPESNTYNKYTIFFTDNDYEKSIELTKACIKELNKIIYDNFFDLAKIELLKTTNEIHNYSNKSENAYMLLLEKEKELTEFTQNNISILTYTNKNQNTVQNYHSIGTITIKKIIISFFICFFLFIVIALITNYFKNLTEDPIQKDKIHKAWIDGK